MSAVPPAKADTPNPPSHFAYVRIDASPQPTLRVAPEKRCNFASPRRFPQVRNCFWGQDFAFFGPGWGAKRGDGCCADISVRTRALGAGGSGERCGDASRAPAGACGEAR